MEDFDNIGFEPELEIDKMSDTLFENSGDYSTLDELNKDIDADETEKAAASAEEVSTSKDGKNENAGEEKSDVEDLKNSEDGDWGGLAVKEFEADMKALGVSKEDITTQNDYIEVASKIGFLQEAIDSDDTLLNSRRFLGQSDKSILQMTLANSNPLDTDEEIVEKLSKYYEEDGSLKPRAKSFVDSQRGQAQAAIERRFSDLTQEAAKYAKQQVEYRDNIYNHVKSYKGQDIELKVDGVEVKIEAPSIDLATRQELLKFSRDEYERTLVGEDIYKDDGYKKRVENSIWLNEKVRKSYIDAIAKASYEKGKSDLIKENIN